MLNRILAVTALGLAVGLAACDQAGQEQAQDPNKAREQQSTSPQTSPPASQSTPSAPSGQTPPAQSPSGSGSSNQ